MSETVAEQNWKRTFSMDLLRSVPMGVTETVGSTFAMFVAVGLLQLDSLSKSAIIGGPAIGLLLGFFTVALVRRLGLSVNIAAAIGWGVAAIGYGLVALNPDSGSIFVAGVVVALLSHALAAPLQSQIYKQHYPDKSRGRLFSTVGMMKAGVSATFGYFAGMWLLGQGGNYGPLFWVFSICSVLKAGFTIGMRPVYLRKTQKLSPFQALEHLKTDKVFRKLISSWMLLGFGNLLCMALFVEFITNPNYGFGYGAEKVSLVTTTIPMLIFIVSVFVWGAIYDKMNFYQLRVIVNAFFFLGILVYFHSPSYTGLCIGMALHGIGKSGGTVLWSLWTTKFAPAASVGEYMSVHTLFTGVRGLISAYLAFVIAQSFGPGIVSVVGASCILISSLMLLPELLASMVKN
ncbi:MFS transporter [Rubritalea sp.]|uniref:MFS transporter n=1 Tax=Rubritalea sp. TaxID=2109375 RepID=UPI0032425EE1